MKLAPFAKETLVMNALLVLALCSTAFATIVPRGISEDGDSGANSRTLQTAGGQAGDSIILMIAS